MTSLADLSDEAQVEWDRDVAALGTWRVEFELDGPHVRARHVDCAGGDSCLCRLWALGLWARDWHTPTDALAESYRRRLGLRTWWAQRDRAEREANYHGAYVARRSGRTTRALLATLAHCALTHRRHLLICGGGSQSTSHCLAEARRFVERLDLDVDPRPHDIRRDPLRDLRDPPQCATYVDHYLAEQAERWTR